MSVKLFLDIYPASLHLFGLTPFMPFQNVRIHSDAILCVSPTETNKFSMYGAMQQLKQDLPKIMIKARLD